MTAQMAQALPDHRFMPITVDHPIFHAFFDIRTLDVPHPSVRVVPRYMAMFEQNDPSRRMIALANWNNDLAEYCASSDPVSVPSVQARSSVWKSRTSASAAACAYSAM